ncbi:MAG: hypothetical protein ACJ76H_14305, partial [Bacteriovoracaceae bacterium]
MKMLALIVLFITQSALACEVKELRKDVFTFFKQHVPVTTQLGEQKAIGKLKDMSLTDSLIHLRGEDFFMTKLVFDVLWADGEKEKREILLAAVVDMA